MTSDEPSREDGLNRLVFARALANVAPKCETPMVIGIYGPWGIGKTSLMQMIEDLLDNERTHVVWFDPWQHQFSESPMLSLMHSVFDSLEGETNKEGAKQTLKIIGTAVGSMLLNTTTGLKITDLLDQKTRFEEEAFQVREAQVRLREHFEKLIDKVRGQGERRIIFFIDDLDRCMPTRTVNLLETLKLYLNLPSCVFFLGVDREVLELSVKHHYGDLKIDAAKYLEKIVQLPFNIPPIAPGSIEGFIVPLLGKELKRCKRIVLKGVGHNPRQAKRFINTLKLSHELAMESHIPNYDSRLLAFLLLLQYRNPELSQAIRDNPELLAGLKGQSKKSKLLREEYLDGNLESILGEVTVPRKNLERYIYLTKVVQVESWEDDERGRERYERIEALTRPLFETRERLLRESSIGTKEIGKQLWTIRSELVRVDSWLRFSSAEVTEQNRILNEIELSEPAEVDKAFLKLVVDSDALFNAEIRARCRGILEQRTQEN